MNDPPNLADFSPAAITLDLAALLPVVLRPDASRTVLRPFEVVDPIGFAVEGRSRAQRIIDRVLTLDKAALRTEWSVVVESLVGRHRDVEGVLLQRYETLDGVTMDRVAISREQSLLIGAYFSEEFSFESAALFNPSIVRHPDQSGVEAGGLRFILSLRGIGEGHVSSVAFRSGVWRATGEVSMDPAKPHAVAPRMQRSQGANGELIVHLFCDGAQQISEKVIYPFLPSQGRGIEDVRLVEFTDDDGASIYCATYTAFNGSEVRQGLLRTTDFSTFEMRGVQGSMYDGKGMALFPRRIDGRYMMIGRQDNENIWLLSSDDFYTWNAGQKLIAPRWPWEFIQMGNCGSPIEIDEGWLLLTHGVGAVRTYCIGACLLDKRDPSKVLARLPRPLLQPSAQARDGYVPNVVYSCGAMVRDRTLLLPHGVADSITTFASVDLQRLVAPMV